MIENLFQIRHFGEYLDVLASSAGYMTAKSFADALNGRRKRRDGLDVISERSVQRWMADNVSPPGERVFKLICLCLEDHGVFEANLSDQRYVHLLILYSRARKRKASKQSNIIDKGSKEFGPIIRVDRNSLQNILTAENHYAIIDILKLFPHDKNTTYALSNIISIGLPFDCGELQEKLGTIVLECGTSPSERKVSAICANALAKVDIWQPAALTLQRLQNYFNIGISSDPFDLQMTLSPLAFALAKMGIQDAIRSTIDLFLTDTAFGNFDFNEISAYYGDDLNQVLSICDHFKERRRTGLMVANDTHRLLRLRDRSEGPIRKTVLSLLRQSGAALIAGGLEHHGAKMIKLSSN